MRIGARVPFTPVYVSGRVPGTGRRRRQSGGGGIAILLLAVTALWGIAKGYVANPTLFIAVTSAVVLLVGLWWWRRWRHHHKAAK